MQNRSSEDREIRCMYELTNNAKQLKERDLLAD
jgi:hypothetical protein